MLTTEPVASRTEVDRAGAGSIDPTVNWPTIDRPTT